ncbi:nitronate monooxygenase family protein [Clostridium swellfunianum]|uniref:NAD(P)H-dependent flavin oxidoreductase n=1 Tax=Clostridium swellfunianum TaxID=1367462 RepID=UPI002030BDE3|nr:nitronate monooxygenase family protein [Clostridium swellfunianum]MCM0650315.1 nitronate monooxygenase family protein [Clostridium swellfunianum]
MKLPPLKIGELVASVPIIQGGMGVGVSRSKLASAVANEGGIGVISSAQIGFEEADFETNTEEANLRAMKKEIKKARELSPKGIIAVNIMVAMNNYREMVKTVVNEKIDLIISGAGLPTELPSLIKGSDTKIAPIVSSGKAAAVITKLWDHKYSYIPDLIVVEGPKAGGHLGYSLEQLNPGEEPELADIVREVIQAIKPYEQKYEKSIPVVAAGGVYTGKDIVELIRIGAAGVQMATRFVATEECDADIRYKMAYVNSKLEDIEIVKSPVGMPGRAIHNTFLDKLKNGRIAVKKCYNCLKPCEPAVTPYCISKALIEAVKGNVEEGLIFTGSNAYRLNKIVTVRELMDELVKEAESL